MPWELIESWMDEHKFQLLLSVAIILWFMLLANALKED